MTDSSQNGGVERTFFLNDPKVRAIIYQVVMVAIVVWAGWSIVDNTATNLNERGIPFGFDFLTAPSGFGINQSLIPYSESSTYGDVYWVGLINTLLVAVIGVFFATILGFLIGIARLSHNWLIARIATVYIEIIRNVPLLLQLFVWYFAVLRLLPAKREALDLGPIGLLNIAGFYAPKPIFGANTWMVGVAILIAIALGIGIRFWARRRQMATGQQFPIGWTFIGLLIVLPLIAYFISGDPITFEYPELARFGPQGGIRVIPEFIGLLLALTLYTAAFIAEIVRAGIMAVSHGQTEAAHALGLRNGPTLRLVIVPQAMRVIIPPLTSQYLNLTKNSSLAVAIAYPDLVSTFTGTALNQTGRAVEIILMTMLTYLAISLLTSAFMNWYNKRVALVER
ncbi:MAG: amino acid ABC transporter permease [Hyphomicrobiaceae bacterium]|nr:amino acid ABC transporter permease [Hyphomicrobiaceae bacterium]MCC0024537.1 amino acid ABC transporter permease [Hyphomicrobiaceae bacterium]